MELVRSLFFYAPNEKKPIPVSWEGMKAIMKGQADYAVDVLKGNRIEVVDVVKRFEKESIRDVLQGASPSKIDMDRQRSHQANLMLKWLKAQDPYDILVIGQTRVSEIFLGKLDEYPWDKVKPFLPIRFSVFYGGRTYPGYKPTWPPQHLGFHLDCPKDYLILLDLLCFEPLLKAVRNRSLDKIRKAVEWFNHDGGEFGELVSPVHIF